MFGQRTAVRNSYISAMHLFCFVSVPDEWYAASLSLPLHVQEKATLQATVSKLKEQLKEREEEKASQTKSLAAMGAVSQASSQRSATLEKVRHDCCSSRTLLAGHFTLYARCSRCESLGSSRRCDPTPQRTPPFCSGYLHLWKA